MHPIREPISPLPGSIFCILIKPIHYAAGKGRIKVKRKVKLATKKVIIAWMSPIRYTIQKIAPCFLCKLNYKLKRNGFRICIFTERKRHWKCPVKSAIRSFP